jgi:predicted anti-sigma-YlaC factor YlaD
MNCETAIELLPWFLNGTLDPNEKEAVRRHLQKCEACRLALTETRETWQTFDQHLPTETIVALAYDEAPIGSSAQEAALHLASCPRCATELEMARTSRRLEGLEGEANVLPFAARRSDSAPVASARSPRGWQMTALAAGLAGVLGLAGWMNRGQEIDTLREQLAARGTTAPAASEPLLLATANPVLLDPLEARMRDFGDSNSTLPAGQASALQLNSSAAIEPAERATITSYRLEVARVAGEKVAEAPVTLQPDGNYAVTVWNLPAGEYELRILGRTPGGEKPYETYRFKVAG